MGGEFIVREQINSEELFEKYLSILEKSGFVSKSLSPDGSE